jgi:hypothetical protein
LAREALKEEEEKQGSPGKGQLTYASFYEQAEETAAGAGLSDEIFRNGINRFLLGNRLKGQPEKAAPELLEKTLAAIKSGNFDWEYGRPKPAGK